MTTPTAPVAPPACITCPNCGAGMDQIQLGEYVYRCWNSMEYNPATGALAVSTASDEVIWEASKDQAFYCQGCNHEWPVPDSITPEWE